MTYPEMFFTIDNFDDVFDDVLIKPGQNVCVEVVATVGSVCLVSFHHS